MKRQAEKQLIKGDDDIEIEEDSPSQGGFKKADDAVLATRVIRGLPKRAGARAPQDTQSNTTTATTTTTTASSSIFSSTSSFASGSFKFEPSTSGPPSTSAFNSSPFPGFGLNKPTTPAADKPSTNSFMSSPFSNPTAPSASTNSGFTFTPTPSVPNMSPTATSTSKAFAASLSSSGNPFGLSSAAAPTPSSSKAPMTNGSSGSATQKYYMDLRGLNVSFLSAASKKVEEDPFFDLAQLHEQYKSFRTKIQEDFDKAGMNNSSTQMETAFTAAAQPPKVSAPAPPTSFVGFGAFKAPQSSAPSTGDAKASPFDFKSSTSSSSNAPNPFAPTNDSKPSNSPFGSSAFPSAPSASTSSPFSLGDSSKPTTSPSANPFGGFGTTTPSTGFTFGASPQPTSTAPKPLFGSSSTPLSFGSTSSTPSSSNIFGKPENKDTSAQQSPFGKAAIKSPVHFTFGSSPSPAPTDSGSAKPHTEGTDGAFGDKAPEDENSERATPAEGDGGAEAQPALFATNPHDEEGEGEENEETVHSIRSKVLRFDNNKWVSYGIGLLKVKKDKDSEARRLLMRNSSTGNVVLNFRLYAGLKLTQDTDQPNTLKFIGHEGGVSQPYSVKVKTKENAAELKSILEREIAFVKAKEET
ncbi:hypothetical protein CVT26_003724 [Gymnopilus dilepis]|uniref:RanBD1 domain-containing protein n=1 Tax=Gymnopilus dilepis TaxID=231916 RepID=A0A409YXH5_9AGAR|nr:hypothetical protein CVT26_003724 [Gymnopilus dilepis]